MYSEIGQFVIHSTVFILCSVQNPEEQISGEFCECDNFNCPRHDRKICAGNGVCNCGQCTCKPGWTGEIID